MKADRKKTGNKLFLFVNILFLIVNIVFAVRLYDVTREDKTQEPEEKNEFIDAIIDDISSNVEYEPYPVGKENFSLTEDSTDTKRIIDIEYISQEAYPTGCESVTTVMALRYMGYDITVDKFIDNYLPKFDLSLNGDVLLGEDPNYYFIGNPRQKSGYGCYAPVIKKILIQIAGQEAVHDLSGMEIDDMISQYVAKGVPVILWGTMNMSEITKGSTWYIERTDTTYTWKGNAHCLLLAGWDNEKYYFYDPLNNHGVIGYDKELVMQRYNEMGCMAVALVKEAK